jgi:hypothetical protein
MAPMILPASVVSPNFHRFLILGGAAALAAACDPNVVIGAKWRVGEAGPDAQVGSESQAGSAGLSGSGGAGGGRGGAEAVVAGAAQAGDGGTTSAGAGGAPSSEPEWCATAPWLDEPTQFTSDDGNIIPQGSYLITYVSGAQIHDLDIGYEVTDYYFGEGGLEAGHHVFSGDSPETGATSLWLDEIGIVRSGGTIAEVEAANRGHSWPLMHAGGELYVTLYDDDYRDNSGPGTRLCVTAASP